MLAYFYKMIFDISFYYSLAAFLIGVVFQQETNPFTFAVLLLTALLAAFAERFPGKKKLVCVIAVLLPAVAFFWEHTLPGRLEFIFPWIYLVILVWKEKLGLDYYQFFGLFKGLVWTWLIYLICTSFVPEAGLFGLEECVPYIILTLTSGVMLLQNLRYQDGAGSTKTFEKFQLKQTAAFLTLCILITVGNVAKLLVWLVSDVIVPGIEYLVKSFLNMLAKLFAKMDMPEVSFRIEKEYLELFEEKIMNTWETNESILEMMEGTKEATEEVEINWLPYIIAAMVVCAVIVFVILLGSSMSKRTVVADTDERETLDDVVVPEKKLKKHSVHPDIVIRFYYRNFMKKAEWGKNVVQSCDTTADIRRKFLERKPVMKEESEEITALYRKARYGTAAVSREDAGRMKRLMEGM